MVVQSSILNEYFSTQNSYDTLLDYIWSIDIIIDPMSTDWTCTRVTVVAFCKFRGIQPL